MAGLKGTNIAAPVVPFADTDSYATHDETYGRGGYRSVAGTADRDAIPQQRRKAGMLVKVLEDGVTYELDSDLVTWKVFSTGGTGSGIGEVTAEAVAMPYDASPAVQVERKDAGGAVDLHFIFGIPVPAVETGYVEFSQQEITLPAEGGSVSMEIVSNLEWRIM